MMTEAKVGRELWLPISKVNVTALVSALSWKDPPFDLWRIEGSHCVVPRAFGGIVKEGGLKWGVKLIDERPAHYAPTGMVSHLKLDHEPGPQGLVPTGKTLQTEAYTALSAGHDGGLELFCGAGKTAISLHHIALRGGPALVVVDDLVLMEQWRRSAQRFLTIPGGIGTWRGRNRNELDRGLVLTTYRTLSSAYDLSEEERRRFATVVYDEGHHLGAQHYHHAASAFYGQRINLSATPIRSDGMDALTRYHIGPSLYRNLLPPLSCENILLQGRWRLPSGSLPGENVPLDKHLAVLSAKLSTNQERLDAIVRFLLRRVSEGYKPLVLTRSLTTLTNLAHALKGLPLPVQDVSDEWEQEERSKHLARFIDDPDNADIGVFAYEIPEHRRAKMAEAPLVLSMLKYGREGMDNPALDLLLLLEPVADSGLLQQIMGRILRPWPGKKSPRMYTLFDRHATTVRMLEKTKQMLRKWPSEKGGPFTFREESL